MYFLPALWENPFTKTKSNQRSTDWWPEMEYFEHKIEGDWITGAGVSVEHAGVEVGVEIYPPDSIPVFAI